MFVKAKIEEKLPDINIGDFAMDILSNMAKDPNSRKPALKESTTQMSDSPDISRVEVSEDYVSMILEGKKPQAKKVVRVTESREDRMENLISKLSGLLSEAKKLLEEISPGTTTTGNIGVNTSFKKKKNKVLDKMKRKYCL